MKLDPETFLEVVRLSPLVSIDLIVRDSQGRVETTHFLGGKIRP